MNIKDEELKKVVGGAEDPGINEPDPNNPGLNENKCPHFSTHNGHAISCHIPATDRTKPECAACEANGIYVIK